MPAHVRIVYVMPWTGVRGRLAAIGLTITASVAYPAMGSAQKLQIAPVFGVYISGGSLFTEGSLTNPSTYLDKRPEGSLLLGATGWFWATDHFGVKATVAFGPSQTAVSDSLGTSDQPGGTWFANAQLVATLTPIRGVSTVYVALGGGMVKWVGPEWTYASGTSVPALVGTVGFTFPVRALWAVKPYKPAKSVWILEISDYYSRGQIDKGLPDQTPVMARNDFTINVMLAVSVGRW